MVLAQHPQGVAHGAARDHLHTLWVFVLQAEVECCNGHANNRMRWQDIGHEPFMDSKFLLEESIRLLKLK